jgi:uncharacterized protein (DUF3820 family)
VAFGQHRGRALSAVDPGWLKWVLTRDFPADLCDVVRAELDRRANRPPGGR